MNKMVKDNLKNKFKNFMTINRGSGDDIENKINSYLQNRGYIDSQFETQTFHFNEQMYSVLLKTGNSGILGAKAKILVSPIIYDHEKISNFLNNEIEKIGKDKEILDAKLATTIHSYGNYGGGIVSPALVFYKD